jgi:hypothetical protein
MLNKSGGKVRLTFKLELDQLWLGTKERTEKLPLNSIKVSFRRSVHRIYRMAGFLFNRPNWLTPSSYHPQASVTSVPV